MNEQCWWYVDHKSYVLVCLASNTLKFVVATEVHKELHLRLADVFELIFSPSSLGCGLEECGHEGCGHGECGYGECGRFDHEYLCMYSALLLPYSKDSNAFMHYITRASQQQALTALPHLDLDLPLLVPGVQSGSGAGTRNVGASTAHRKE